MTMTTDAPPTPRRSHLDRATAHALAVEEYRRVADAIAALDAADWTRPTDCPAWNVQQLVAHMLGMAVMPSAPLQMMKQTRAAKKRQQPGTELVDALTAVQVDLYAGRTPADLLRLMREAGPKAARGRRRMGALAGGFPSSTENVNGVREPWTVGYLMGTILTRDPWMHRIDLARATGRDVGHTADHDGVIVADVVTEWAERHGRPYRLTLTGPAGGTWSSGTDVPGTAEEIAMDAVDFVRTVSGRAPGDGLLATQVPF